MLQSDLCDHSDVYIAVKRTITDGRPNNNAYGNKLVLKNNTPFISWITKINNTLFDYAEDLGITMTIYNLIEYSKNYSKTSETFWNYSKSSETWWNYYGDQPNSGIEGTENNINYFIKSSKPLDCKTSITGKLENNDATKNVKIAVP